MTPWPQWPLILRTSGAHEEGGERGFSVSTTHFTGEDGRVKELHGCEVGPAPDSRRSRAASSTMPADLVLLAMGFLHPQHEGFVEQLGVDLDPRGNVSDANWQTSVPGVFACGDARRGQSLIVWAIAEGRQAARAVDQYLDDLDHPENATDLVELALRT